MIGHRATSETLNLKTIIIWFHWLTESLLSKNKGVDSLKAPTFRDSSNATLKYDSETVKPAFRNSFTNRPVL